MRRATLILNSGDVRKAGDIKKSIAAVEKIFYEYGNNRTQMPAKIYLRLDKYNGDFRAMPAYAQKLDRCVLKWVNVHPRNSRFGLPAVMAVIILNDPRTGFPLCVMDGTFITALRTGSAGAVAAKYLARKNSTVAAMVGCGAQARAQLAALSSVFSLKEVCVWGDKESAVNKFIRDMRYLGLKFKPSASVCGCVAGGDIVITTTPSRKPLIKSAWIKEGAHINAIGADAKGKEELEPELLGKSKIVVDSLEQAAHSGEINVPLERGEISLKDIYADIGEIVAGKKRGRINNKEITVFDSTGLAIQDLAVADLIYREALEKKIGRNINLV